MTQVTQAEHYTEQARQLALKIFGGANLNNVIAERAIRDIASALAEAATQGQAVLAEEINDALTSVINGAERSEAVLKVFAIINRARSGLRSGYLDRVRSELNELKEGHRYLQGLIHSLSAEVDAPEDAGPRQVLMKACEAVRSLTEKQEQIRNEAARYFCGEHLKLLSESQVEKFVCFWCAQNKIAEREAEAATAALEQERKRIVDLIKSRQRWHETNYKADVKPVTTEGRIWTESQRVAAKTLTELIAAIGDDKQDQG